MTHVIFTDQNHEYGQTVRRKNELNVITKGLKKNKYVYVDFDPERCEA